MNSFADILRPVLPTSQELLPYLESIDQTRIYSNFGPLHMELKSRLANYFSVTPEHVALSSNGTLALAGLVDTQSTENSRWTVPSWTFVATAHAVLLSGRKLDLSDVDPLTWQLIEHAHNDEILVLPFGAPYPQNLAKLEGRCRVVDAAASFDALRHVGIDAAESTPIMISAHATKLLSMGEGGIVLGHPQVIEDFERWSNFDFSGNRISQRRAINAKPSELACAVGLAHLDIWESQRLRYQEIFHWYLTHLPEEVTVQPSMTGKHVTSTLVIAFGSSDCRTKFLELATAHRIASRSWWGSGLHTMPFVEQFSAGKFPVTEHLTSTTIGVPFHLDLIETDVQFICNVIHESLV